MEVRKISIVGSGSWGTTLAILLGEKGFKVSLYCRRQELADKINREKENKQYLEGVKIPDSVVATTRIGDIADSQIVVFAVPSEYLRETAKSFSEQVKNSIIIHVVKGVENSTGKLMSTVLKEELGNVKLAVLSGPNHAEEVAHKLPTATVIASEEEQVRKIVSETFHTTYFKAYPHDDVKGVEICGSIKNIVAIAMGVCSGLKFGDNSQASILTLGLSEMGVIAKALGAKRDTCYGLAGVGDLVATCYSSHSRNRFVGEMLAKGKTMEEIKEDMHGMIAEGVKNTKTIHKICEEKGVLRQTPLIDHSHKVLYGGIDLRKAIAELLNIV